MRKTVGCPHERSDTTGVIIGYFIVFFNNWTKYYATRARAPMIAAAQNRLFRPSLEPELSDISILYHNYETYFLERRPKIASVPRKVAQITFVDLSLEPIFSDIVLLYHKNGDITEMLMIDFIKKT
jgi:hypothetical protein